MYRFLLTPRWIAGALLALTLAAGMVLAGNWQLDRYHDRSAKNARIDESQTIEPVPLTGVLPAPGDRPGRVGPPATADTEWSRVTMTGRYDPTNEILIRGRTVAGRVGFEVVTPFLLDGGAALLVDRGWIPPADGDAAARPAVPAPPAGTVTVTGRVVRSESGSARLGHTEGRLDARRVAVPRLAEELPYPLFGGYLLLDEGQPGGGDEFVAIPSRRERAWQNGGYAVQWWLFAALTVAVFGWLVRREAAGPHPVPADPTAPADPTTRVNATAPADPTTATAAPTASGPATGTG